MSARYRADDLRQFAVDLLIKQEMSEEVAQTVADILLEGDFSLVASANLGHFKLVNEKVGELNRTRGQ